MHTASVVAKCVHHVIQPGDTLEPPLHSKRKMDWAHQEDHTSLRNLGFILRSVGPHWRDFFFYWSVAWLDFSFRKIMAAGWRMIWGHVDIDREGSKDIAKKKLMDSTKKKTKNQTLPSRKLLEDFKNSMIWLMFEDSLAPGLNIYWQWEGTSSCDHRDKGLPRLWPGR